MILKTKRIFFSTAQFSTWMTQNDCCCRDEKKISKNWIFNSRIKKKLINVHFVRANWQVFHRAIAINRIELLINLSKRPIQLTENTTDFIAYILFYNFNIIILFLKCNFLRYWTIHWIKNNCLLHAAGLNQS